MAAPADDVLPAASAVVVEVAQPEAPAESAPAEPSLAESVVAEVAAAIVAETVVGAQPDEVSRRRPRSP